MFQTSLTTPRRYHPALVALHWIIAILILTNVVLAKNVEGPRGEANLAGIPVIYFHMALGFLILVLSITRLVVRLATPHPAWADTGNIILNKIGVLTHWGFYLLTLGMPITGIILAIDTNQLERLLNTASGQSSSQFAFGLGDLHGMIWFLLFLLILLHVGAVFYHQFFIKDNLLKRIWFGKRFGE